jgi:hypothetical protein
MLMRFGTLLGGCGFYLGVGNLIWGWGLIWGLGVLFWVWGIYLGVGGCFEESDGPVRGKFLHLCHDALSQIQIKG